MSVLEDRSALEAIPNTMKMIFFILSDTALSSTLLVLKGLYYSSSVHFGDEVFLITRPYCHRKH